MTRLDDAPTNRTLECEVEHEVERLATLVHRMRSECESLRRSLAKAEAERDLYLKAIYEHERDNREFENVTIAELEEISAGPVEMI